MRPGFNPWVRKIEGNGNPLQYSCLENAMDRGAWWAAVHGVAKSQTGLNDFSFSFFQLHLFGNVSNALMNSLSIIEES